MSGIKNPNFARTIIANTQENCENRRLIHEDI